jgi:hypothetical protein
MYCVTKMPSGSTQPIMAVRKIFFTSYDIKSLSKNTPKINTTTI